jgi:iron complex outermembrane receptor protein|tara:strand:- start:6445 stop:8661 length:2217 start_codon:yes stop_codon:yes gene_type:complete
MKTKILVAAVIASTTGSVSAQDDDFLFELEEIVVTAQKREQSMHDVPFSVSAVTGETLKDNGVFDIIDLQATTPSLMSPSTGSPGQGASFRLRGFGSPPFQLGIEPAVATFVDGVYRSRSGVAVNDLIDIDRIEILKGPQGTLFGKNTTAGVIHIISKGPNLEETEGFVEASYEKYDRTRLKGMVNVPLSDTAALRVSGMWGEGDGWLENIGPIDDLNNLNRHNIRAQLLFVPSDDFHVNISLQTGEIDETCCTTLRYADGPFTSVLKMLAGAEGATVITPPNPDHLLTSINEQQSSKSEDTLLSVNANWNLDNGMTLTSVTSWQDFELSTLVDGDFTGADLLIIESEVEITAFTQELRLSGGSEKVDWTAGIYYADEEIDRLRIFDWQSQVGFFFPPFLSPMPGVGVVDTLGQSAETLAVFTHGTYRVNEQLAVTAGLRFNSEEKDAFGRFEQLNNIVLAMVNPSFEDGIDETATTGTLSVQYDVSDNIMTYATYTHGYKSGGINLAREASGLMGQPSDATFSAEEVDTFELGAKMDLMDRHLRVNAALFMSGYDDVQNQIFVPPSFLVRNGEGADIIGLEIEGLFAATQNLTLNFGLTLLNTEFASGTDLGAGDIGGRSLPWAPETAASLGWNYSTAINDEMGFFWTGSAIHKSEYYANSGSELSTVQGSSNILNSQLGIRSDAWRLAIWCRNCFDERVSEVIFNSPVDFWPGMGAAVETYVNRPTEMGVTLRYDF